MVPKKGISSGAKTILQDEYVTKPRHVSSIPVNLMPTGSKLDNNGDAVGDAAGDGRHRGGKRMGPAPIPQVFIL
uniref:Uncharacterized protein n=1 Tax=Globisporangium ultimum (strain ATCC 200006 / CBS 805.95 / DAOM BR144) TaxID=431595 RepID=K3WDV6_GLOUD